MQSDNYSRKRLTSHLKRANKSDDLTVFQNNITARKGKLNYDELSVLTSYP
jgi:hypothetical protein